MEENKKPTDEGKKATEEENKKTTDEGKKATEEYNKASQAAQGIVEIPKQQKECQKKLESINQNQEIINEMGVAINDGRDVKEDLKSMKKKETDETKKKDLKKIAATTEKIIQQNENTQDKMLKEQAKDIKPLEEKLLLKGPQESQHEVERRVVSQLALAHETDQLVPGCQVKLTRVD